jgi:ElaB/YqjD/DUF883 family membrane-anchored ribosome-binding protein
MDDEPEVIRQQMADTRSSLTDKIERLEQTVEQKVQSTTAAVTDTVESVKDAVQDTVETVKGTVTGTVDTVRSTVNSTVETVKEAFDVRGYFEQYPWASFGAAVGVGIAGGVLLGGGGRAAERIADLHSRGEVATTRTAPSHNGGGRKRSAVASRAASLTTKSADAAHQFAGELASKFGDELGKLKGVALGAMFGLVRDWISRSAPPEVGNRVGEVIDDVTRKLGGEPIRGNLLDSFTGLTGGKSSREREASAEARPGSRMPSI